MGRPHTEYRGHKDHPHRRRGPGCLHHPDNLSPEGGIFTPLGLCGYVRLCGTLALTLEFFSLLWVYFEGISGKSCLSAMTSESSHESAHRASMDLQCIFYLHSVTLGSQSWNGKAAFLILHLFMLKQTNK